MLNKQKDLDLMFSGNGSLLLLSPMKQAKDTPSRTSGARAHPLRVLKCPTDEAHILSITKGSQSQTWRRGMEVAVSSLLPI